MARKLRDARLASKVRRDRSLDNVKAADARTLGDQERLDEFRMAQHNNVLPNLPKIKGYHVIWLTTKNPSDTLAARMRLGYEPIKPSEIPGFESLSIKTGEYSGMIGVNEMVAFKLPLHLYEMYMRENHHDAPMLEEQKLTDAVEAVKEQLLQGAKRGKKSVKVEAEEGTENVVMDRRPPRFARATGER